MPTTAATARPYRRLTAAKAITATVLQNVRRLTVITAGTERRLSPVVRATQAALTSQIVRPKSAPGLVTQDIKSQEILV